MHDHTDPDQFRNTSLQNDRRNNRKDGKLRAKSIKLVDRRGVCTCKFQFMVKWDIDGFYIDLHRNAGHPYHTYHSKILDPNSIPLPTQFLTSNQIEDALHVIKATSNNGSARNYLSEKFDHFVNLSKISYLKSQENGHLLSPHDDIEHMMDNFALFGDISFVSLSDVPVEEYFAEKCTVKSLTTLLNSGTVSTSFKNTITVATAKDFSGKIVYTEIHAFPGIACMADTIQDERCDHNLTKTDALFITVAFRLFKLCQRALGGGTGGWEN
jgi:hypothetical protein